MPKTDWEGSVRARKGFLYLRFFKEGRRHEKAAHLRDTEEGRAEAEALLAELRRTIKAMEGIRAVAGAGTVRAYAREWLEGREGNTSKVDDKQRLEDHVYPAIGALQIGDVRATDIKRLISDLKRKASPRGDKLAPKTIRNVYAVLSAMFRDAVIEGKIPASPCVLRGKHLPAARDKDPEWRDTAVFEMWEVSMLIYDERIPLDRRVFYALMFLGCCRFGEAAALRWRHYESKLEPLGKLRVVESYNTRHKITKETKAERPRMVPVAPQLAAILAEWKLSGWREFMKGLEGMDRPPQPDDLMVPSRLGKNRSANHMLRKFHKDLRRLKTEEHKDGLRERRQHDARRTWLSTVLAAGANETHAKWTAHGPPRTVLGHYMTLPWPTLCKVVDGLDLTRGEERHG